MRTDPLSFISALSRFAPKPASLWIVREKRFTLRAHVKRGLLQTQPGVIAASMQPRVGPLVQGINISNAEGPHRPIGKQSNSPDIDSTAEVLPQRQ